MTILRPSPVIGGSFSLTDDRGRPVTDDTYRGKWRLIFFGFTHCKVVCPENLTKLSQALVLIGPLADRVQPLYISVDPERDTPEVMRAFLAERYPRFTGLTGDPQQTRAIKAAYKVYAEREIADENGDYDVPHSAMTFLMDPEGAYVTHFSDADPSGTIAGRLADLLARVGA